MDSHETETDQSPLFSPAPVVQKRTAPVIVVGLPRSGSSFLSHVLSSLDDYYVFDDLYLLQQVQALGAENRPLTSGELRKLTGFLGWAVRARIRYEDSFRAPDCTWEDMDRMVEAVRTAFEDKAVYWHTLLEEWLTRLAWHHGRRRWGYKTPQDFHHLDLLTDRFPGARFVFIMRDPRRMMASMKYVRDADGDPRQYHPIVYALYWRMARRAVDAFRAKDRAPVHEVRFEALVSDPDGEARRLAAFLSTSVSATVELGGTNTSFKAGRRGLTGFAGPPP